MSRPLSRPQLAARIAALRTALDTLWSQSDLDGTAPYASIGRMKVELIELEQQLRTVDGEPLPFPVAYALAGRGGAA